ncbi:MAG: hypothetical protein IID32_07715 [Planctomycetes bacterium]|nr:hypothetical protein [Planctomycetota bacterium]
MKKNKLFLIVVVISFLFSACGNPTVNNALVRLNRDAKKNHSPYRYRAEQVNGGHAVQKYLLEEFNQLESGHDQTVADTILKSDILAAIKKIETQEGNFSTPQLNSVHLHSVVGNSFIEIWFIRMENIDRKYHIILTSSPQGGTDYSVKGPL